MRFSIIVLLAIAHTLPAQTPENYTNSHGERHIAGPFKLDLLKTDTTFKKWFEANSQKFKLKGESTKWKNNLKTTQVDIYLGSWCRDSKNQVPQFVKMWTDLGLKEEQLHFTALFMMELKNTSKVPTMKKKVFIFTEYLLLFSRKRAKNTHAL